jgi:hypothetical protein
MSEGIEHTTYGPDSTPTLRAASASVYLPSSDLQEVEDEEPIAPPKGQVTGATLFETLRALAVEASAIGAARRCLDALVRAVPCRAALLHVLDTKRWTFVVLAASGADAGAVMHKRCDPRDPLLRAAFGASRAFALNHLSRAAAMSIDRFARLGGARRVLMAPVTCDGCVLAAFELVDPVHGVRFTTHDSRALVYVARHFGRFLVEERLLGDLGAWARGPA